jgi:hypothetical protein
MSMKNSIDSIENRTRGLPACSIVSQPTAPEPASENRLKYEGKINPLTPELNPSAQRCLTRFFTEDFASLTCI